MCLSHNHICLDILNQDVFLILYFLCLFSDVPDALRVIWKYNIDANKKEVMFFQ